MSNKSKEAERKANEKLVLKNTLSISSMLDAGGQAFTNTLPLSQITLPQSQPRKYFDEQRMQQLIESVRRDGILQPLLVRPAKEEGNYELIAGERRYRAAQKLGLTEVPVTIREMTDEQAMQYSLVENLQREDLNPVEETEGILLLLAINLGCEVAEVPPLLYRMQDELKGKVPHNVMGKAESRTIQSVFQSLSRMSWDSFTSNRLPLLKLPTEILETIRTGKLEYTKAKVIAQVKEEVERQRLLKEAITQELSLSQIREKVKALKTSSDSTNEPLGGNELRKRVSKLNSLSKKSEALEDPQTRQKVEKLLTQLEKLLG